MSSKKIDGSGYGKEHQISIKIAIIWENDISQPVKVVFCHEIWYGISEFGNVKGLENVWNLSHLVGFLYYKAKHIIYNTIGVQIFDKKCYKLLSNISCPPV